MARHFPAVRSWLTLAAGAFLFSLGKGAGEGGEGSGERQSPSGHHPEGSGHSGVALPCSGPGPLWPQQVFGAGKNGPRLRSCAGGKGQHIPGLSLSAQYSQPGPHPVPGLPSEAAVGRVGDWRPLSDSQSSGSCLASARGAEPAALLPAQNEAAGPQTTACSHSWTPATAHRRKSLLLCWSPRLTDSGPASLADTRWSPLKAHVPSLFLTPLPRMLSPESSSC